MSKLSPGHGKKAKPVKRSRERGNVFVFILLGVFLFAALSFTMSRGFRGDVTSKMNDREAVLAAADILSYAQRLEQAVSKIRRNSVSENDLSFDNNEVSGYTHGSPQPDAHKIFHLSGGGMRWQGPPKDANDGSDWLFTGATCIAGIGTGATGCNSDAASNEELIAVLPNLDVKVCTTINDRLNISTTPTDTGGGYSSTKFTGTYADGTELILGDAYRSACYTDGTNYHFYAVILER